MRRQRPEKNVSAAAKRAAEASDSKAARKAAWIAGICGACRHFLSIHGPRGCAARSCDCKANDGKSVKGGGDA